MSEQPPARDDINLVRRAQEGDQAAFAELFQSYHQPVLNYVYRMLGDRGAAEDITQDAFIRAHQHLGKLGPPYNFKAWIYRIAGNLSLNLLEREKRLVHVEEFDEHGEPTEKRRPAEDKLRRKEAREAVWNTLDRIPTLYRQTLILREFDQLSYEEISGVLERSYDSVRQLVHRARVRFQAVHIGRLMLVEGPARCAELGDLISAYRDDELEADERKAAQEHIASCADCQSTEKDLRKVGALLAVIPPIIPTKAWVASALERVFQSEPHPAQSPEIPKRDQDGPRSLHEPMQGPPSSSPPANGSPKARSLFRSIAVIGGAVLGLIIVVGLLTLWFSGEESPLIPDTSWPSPSPLPLGSSPVNPTSPTEGLSGQGEDPTEMTPTPTPSPAIAASTTLTPTPTSTPTSTLTATPTVSPPSAPVDLAISERVCSKTEYVVTLNWTDTADNEEGFLVYRDEVLIAKLEVDSMSYKDYPPGSGPYLYGIQAFNESGTSEISKVEEEGCSF